MTDKEKIINELKLRLHNNKEALALGIDVPLNAKIEEEESLLAFIDSLPEDLTKTHTTMKQEDKELLLKDLCARLPYGLKVAIEFSQGKYSRVYDLREIDNDSTSESRRYVTIWDYGHYSSVISYELIECRPYLRPMDSMTEEEKKVYEHRLDCMFYDSAYDAAFAADWLLEHHFDYRGLIEKGLALEAPEGLYNN